MIIEYLEERFPEPPLLPADPPSARSPGFGSGGMTTSRSRTTPPGVGMTAPRERLGRRARRPGRVLEAQPYLTGRDFGLADIAYVPWIFRGQASFGLDVRAVPVARGVARASARAPLGHRRERGRRRAVRLVLLHAFPLDERMWEPLGRGDASRRGCTGPGRRWTSGPRPCSSRSTGRFSPAAPRWAAIARSRSRAARRSG